MTKKRASEILPHENRNFFSEKVKSGNFRRSLRNVSEIGGNSETRGKCVIAFRGMDAPAQESIKYEFLMKVCAILHV